MNEHEHLSSIDLLPSTQGGRVRE